MRILVISPVFPPYRGGMGSVAFEQAAMLSRAGYDVVVVTPSYGKPSSSEHTAYGIVERWNAWISWGNAAVLSFRLLVERIRSCDRVHLHYPFFGTALSVAFLARLFRKPLIVTWHMRAVAESGAWIRGIIFFLARYLQEPFVRWCAKSIMVSSEDYGNWLGIPRACMSVVPFGVDERRFFPRTTPSLLRETWGFSEGTCVFLFVGGMDIPHAFKGVPILLEAFAKLATSEAGDVGLVLVGDGFLREQFMKLAQELGIAQHCRFLGSVSDQELPEVYRASDVHVLPSVSQAETYGIVTREAAFCGIPSLVSDLPGVRTGVVPSETGEVILPGDVKDLYEHMARMVHRGKASREDLGRRAYERACKLYSQAREREELLRNFL